MSNNDKIKQVKRSSPAYVCDLVIFWSCFFYCVIFSLVTLTGKHSSNSEMHLQLLAHCSRIPQTEQFLSLLFQSLRAQSS